MKRSHTTKVTLLALACLVIGIAVSYEPILNSLAKVLVRDDPLRKMDAAIVLSGDNGLRTDAAIELLKQGYVDLLIFSGSEIFEGIPLAKIFKQYVVSRGVPESKIVAQPMEEESEMSTYGEALFNVGLLRKSGSGSFILVTSDYHTARAGRFYERVIEGTDLQMIVHAARDPFMHFEGWWRDRYSAKTVLLEWQKTVYYRFAY